MAEHSFSTLFENILAEVERSVHISRKELLGQSRRKELVSARKMLWCALRMAGYSTTAIAERTLRTWPTIAKLTKYSSSEIKDMSAFICSKLGIEALDVSELEKKNRKKYQFRQRLKKVPDYKNNCIKWVEI